jgi:hypothetical protein
MVLTPLNVNRYQLLKNWREIVPINFAKNGSEKILQNFAKLNSLPKSPLNVNRYQLLKNWREIRTYKFCEKR